MADRAVGTCSMFHEKMRRLALTPLDDRKGKM
jgi:hypothetical protein